MGKSATTLRDTRCVGILQEQAQRQLQIQRNARWPHDHLHVIAGHKSRALLYTEAVSPCSTRHACFLLRSASRCLRSTFSSFLILTVFPLFPLSISRSLRDCQAPSFDDIDFSRERWKRLATDQDGFAKITVPVLKKFMQEEKARAKGDKVQTAQAKKLVTKGGKQELIQLIREYFGVPSSAAPQPEISTVEVEGAHTLIQGA